MYNSISELLNYSNEKSLKLWETVLKREIKLTGSNEKDIFRVLDERFAVMYSSAKRALDGGLETAGGLITGIASAQYGYAMSGSGIAGGFVNTLMAYALSCSETNAAMGRICAAPTAGSCGIIPAVLIALEEREGLERRTTLEALLTASGIGAVVMQNATVAGSEGGCQAECGVAAGMAAAAAVQMMGGSNDTAVIAFCIALMNVMGLVCDPVAGLVQVPCAQRNASQAVNAVISADMALGGMVSPVPADEMIEAMYNVGKLMPVQLKETADGGMAATPAGKAITREIYHLTDPDKDLDF